MFRINIEELRKTLSIFSFIKANETVVDYTFLQLVGVKDEPLRLQMSNGAIFVSTQITAKIDADFVIRVQLGDLLTMIRHLDGVFEFEIGEKALLISNERIHHQLTIVPGEVNYPSVQVIDTTKTVQLPFKGLLGLENIVIQHDSVVAFDDLASTLKYIKGDFGVDFMLTAVQAKFLSDLGTASLVRVGDKLHITDNANVQAILVEAIANKPVPPIDKLLEYPTTTKFKLNRTEVKELQTLLHADTLAIMVKDGTLRVVASDKHTSEWVKQGIEGTGFVKIKAKTLRELSNDVTVSLLDLGRATALKIDDGKMITIGAGLVR